MERYRGDRQKWSRIMGSHQLPRSIPRPPPISHSNYARRHERLTVKKEKKTHLRILLITKLLPSSPQVRRSPTVRSVSPKWRGARASSHVGNEARGGVVCRRRGGSKRNVCVLFSTQINRHLRGRETNPRLWGQEIILIYGSFKR